LENFYTIFDSLRGKDLFIVGDALVTPYDNIVRKNRDPTDPLPYVAGVGFPFDSRGLHRSIKNLRWYGIIEVSVAKKLLSSIDKCVAVSPVDTRKHSVWIKEECMIGNVAVFSAGDKPVPFGSHFLDDDASNSQRTVSIDGPMTERVRTLSNNANVLNNDPRNAGPSWKMPDFVFLSWD